MQNKTPLNEPFSSTDDALGENLRLLILQEAFDELSYQKPANFKNGCKLIFYAAEVEEVLDGDAFYIRFDVADDAAPGTYPVKLVIEQALDSDSNDVSIVVINGSIIVE